MLGFYTRGHNKPKRGANHQSHPGQLQASDRKRHNKAIREEQEKSAAETKGISVQELNARKFKKVHPLIQDQTTFVDAQDPVEQKEVGQYTIGFECEACSWHIPVIGPGLAICKQCSKQYNVCIVSHSTMAARAGHW